MRCSLPEQDILFKTGVGVFSYRVAGVLVKDGKVLLQRAGSDPAYAFPGGHVNFGETSAQALVREFAEELNAPIDIVRLLWLGEIFFPWGDKDCHQICLFYLVKPGEGLLLPWEGEFSARDRSGPAANHVRFSWVSFAELEQSEVAPAILKPKLLCLADQIETFIFRESR
jgi:8-oxo-dGTP pyrophosphatase MutT (NUDIX family)